MWVGLKNWWDRHVCMEQNKYCNDGSFECGFHDDAGIRSVERPLTKSRVIKECAEKQGIPVIDIGMSGYLNQADFEHELTMVHADMDAKADRDGCEAPKAQDAEPARFMHDILADAARNYDHATIHVDMLKRYVLENGLNFEFYHSMANRMVDAYNNSTDNKSYVLALSLSPKRK